MFTNFRFLQLVLLLAISNSLFSQYYYNRNYYDNDFLVEFGAGVGGMNCITDLGLPEGNKKLYLNEIKWKFTNLSSTYYLGVMYQQKVGIRLETSLGQVEAVDSILPKNTPRYNRNLSFRSPIREIAFVTEFHPFMFKYREFTPRISPYLMLGGGWFKFNPQANLNGRWLDLQPLRTEGQGFAEYPDRKPYSLSNYNISGGVGVKYEVSALFNLRFEWLQRYLFTDYLDDVSTRYIDESLFSKYLSPFEAARARALHKRGAKPTSIRGNPKNNDTYLTLMLKLGVCIGRSRVE